MKQFLFMFSMVLFFSTDVLAQDSVHHFRKTDQTVIWQEIYQTRLTTQQLKDLIKTSGSVKILEETDDRIIGELVLTRMNYKIDGYSRSLTPNYIANNKYVSAFIVIEFKEHRYKVTLKKIVLVKKNKADKKRKIIEKYALIMNVTLDQLIFEKKFVMYTSIILDHTFHSSFDFSKTNVTETW